MNGLCTPLHYTGSIVLIAFLYIVICICHLIRPLYNCMLTLQIKNYLNISAWFLIIGEIKSIIAIAYCELANVFNTMGTTLYCNFGNISHGTQVNNQLLNEIRIFSRPRCTSLTNYYNFFVFINE